MANPQLENGFVKIAGELVSALSRTNLCAYESRIVWCILQKTYGWKRRDRISFTQFEEVTHLKRWHIARTLDLLIERNIITRTGTTGPEYGIQKDYELWKTFTKS
jgi:phage replication O-like protein O